MTQQEIARERSLHIQTVRKRLKAGGLVTRSHSTAPTAQELDEVRGLLDACLSARESARKLGVAHTSRPVTGRVWWRELGMSTTGCPGSLPMDCKRMRWSRPDQ